MSSRSIHVALPWHSFGHGNLGVDALTRANIAILRAAAARAKRSIHFTTLCSDARLSENALPQDISIGPLPRLKPLLAGQSDFIAALRKCDLVVDIGEGDSWTDIYGAKRFAFHVGTKLAALFLGKPLVLAPQTIGPFNHPVRKHISDAVMNRARAVFSRDTLSSEYLASRGLRTEAAEFIDVAFRLPYTPSARVGGRIRVGLNVSGLLYKGGYSGRNELGLTIDYVDLTHRLIEAFAERKVEIHLIPHVIAHGGNDDDRSVIPALTQRYPMLRVPPPFASASDAKSFISGMDFIVGGRMHACIGAFSAKVPVVPIAYSRKFNGLFGTLGYSHFVDGKVADTDSALAAILAAFEKRYQLSADIEAGLEIASARLNAYEDRLVAILQELP